jgi:hypothetical protein
MADTSTDALAPDEAPDPLLREDVKKDQDKLRNFVKGLSGDDIKSGNWFEKLIAHALGSYTDKATWQYFQEKYESVPADGIVDQRIKMASRYAALEGGLSASAYTGAIAATIGSLGGASPASVPAAIVTVMVDVAFLTQLQLRLAYDVAVLYRVPLDLSDPADLWKLIRVAFTIKSGEVAREGVAKVLPPLTRKVLKRFYSKEVLHAAKGLPFVGKFLLQRNVIKIGIPLIGVPVAVVLNRYSTLIAGRHARSVFRNEARVIEMASGLSARSRHPQLALLVTWLVIMADHKIADDEALLMKHLVRIVREDHDVIDEQLAQLIEIEPADVWRRIDAEEGDLTDLLDVAERVASINGAVNPREQAIVDELRARCGSPAADVPEPSRSV